MTHVENEMLKKYDLIANKIALTYKCIVKIIPYVMTWDWCVTKFHTNYRSESGIQPKTEAYIQSVVLKKTLESISFDRRRGLEEDDGYHQVDELVSKMALERVPTETQND